MEVLCLPGAAARPARERAEGRETAVGEEGTDGGSLSTTCWRTGVPNKRFTRDARKTSCSHGSVECMERSWLVSTSVIRLGDRLGTPTHRSREGGATPFQVRSTTQYSGMMTTALGKSMAVNLPTLSSLHDSATVGFGGHVSLQMHGIVLHLISPPCRPMSK